MMNDTKNERDAAIHEAMHLSKGQANPHLLGKMFDAGAASASRREVAETIFAALKQKIAYDHPEIYGVSLFQSIDAVLAEIQEATDGK
jgi:5-carboxymethyl-2-hydroxymuconate isomerase